MCGGTRSKHRKKYLISSSNRDIETRETKRGIHTKRERERERERETRRERERDRRSGGRGHYRI